MTWRPYDGVPAVHALSNGSYAHEPQWYRGFLYAEERARGLDDTEDLAAPGVFQLGPGRRATPCCCSAPTGRSPATSTRSTASTGSAARSARAARGSRRRLAPRGRRLPRAARRGQDDRRRLSLVHRLGARHVHRAPRPLPRDRPAGRRAVDPARVGGPRLRGHAAQPVRRPGRRARVQHGRRLALVRRRGARVSRGRRRRRAGRRPRATARRCGRRCRRILAGHVRGTRYGIRVADDGLLAAGEPGVQLTWMDAKVGDWVVTPRIGKPVEIQALWLNALRIAERFTPSYAALYASAARRPSRAASGTPTPAASTTWSTPTTCPGRLDPTLPAQPDPRRRRAAVRRSSTASGPAQVVDAVERQLLDAARAPHAGARRGRATRRATRAACASATAPTTRARSGRGCSGRSSRPGCGCAADGADVEAEARRRFLAAAARSPRRGGRRARLRDRRRRAAAHAARLPVPGVVGGRGAPARSAGARPAVQPVRRGGSVRSPSPVSAAPPSDGAACADDAPPARVPDGGRAARPLHDLGVRLHRAAGASRRRRCAAPFPIRSCAGCSSGSAMGATAVLLIYSPWGKQSGAHCNPAITLTFIRLGKVRAARRAWPTSVAQFAGAVGGVLIARIAARRPCWPIPTCGYAATLPGPRGVAVAFVAEVGISFLLMSGGPRGLEPSPLGRVHRPLRGRAWWRCYITFEAPLSGMSMNPARTFGSAFFAGDWTRPLDLLHRRRRWACSRRPSCTWRGGAGRRSPAPSCITRTRSAASSASTRPLGHGAAGRPGNQSVRLDIIARVTGITFGSATAQGDRRMKRRTWIVGLVVLGGVGWYLFRPELLFVNKRVNEELVTASASTGRARTPRRRHPERAVPLGRARDQGHRDGARCSAAAAGCCA